MASAIRPRRVQFKTGRIIQRSRRATAKAFDQVTKEMTTALRKVLKKPFPPASRPGNPPHKRTGFLQGNTVVSRKGRNIFVRTPTYGIFLDGGTSRMAARPFIRKTIQSQKRKWTKRINDLIRRFDKT